MCGIAGVFETDGKPVEQALVQAMGDILAHRGPDDSDLWCHGSIGLAHRRLSIIDLSERGRQPMHDGQSVLVYNGEVYNYRELRAQLESLGHTFHSDTDSEVLLKSYRQWGRDCLSRFNGMFSFAIWDGQQQELFCARDRMGIKPFNYSRKGSRFAFASEAKALLVDPDLRKLRLRPLVRFLGEGLVDDEPESFFTGVEVLPAAHWLVVGPGKFKVERYWDLSPGYTPETVNGRPLKASFAGVGNDYFPEIQGLDEAAENLRHLLSDAVRLRLRSDVPVGTCLSGGLDSSSIVCLASQLIDEPVRTFSSVYPQADCNEADYIEKVVKGCQTRATRVEPTPEELPRIFEKLTWHQDEPTAGPGLYSQWKVMEAAQKEVTVLLDGQGGDELLAGYFHYFRDYLGTLAAQLVARKEGESRLWAEVEAVDQLTGTPHREIAERALRRARRPGILKVFQRERPGRVKPSELLRAELVATIGKADQRRTRPNSVYSETLNQKLYNDLTRYSIPALLRYEDRNSMAYSLEARTPFLDHRLVEFCFSLPFQYKIQPPLTKLVLRKAMDGYLPPEVTRRADKMGYPTPASHWFRGELKGWLQDLFHSQGLAEHGIFEPQACRRLLDAHLSGQDHSWDLWRIASVETWCHLFLDGHGFKK